ncbi:MAG: periplasmic heavy metal sensor [Candidatus Adiutrix sp.]|jgi:hypothetical protein|nr:periplasmic heavy metal sensor [Candidatus Adiutrix sp.]
MSMKKTALALSFAMLFAFTAAAMVGAQEKNAAQPKGENGLMINRMTPEEWEAFSAMRDEHRMKLAPIQDQLWAKQMEYDALADNPNTKPAEIKAIVDEMVKLRAQLRTERNSLRDQAQSKGFHRNPGWGGQGYGHAYGHAYGPGCEFGYGQGHWGDRDDRGYRGGRGYGRGHRGGGYGHHRGGNW